MTRQAVITGIGVVAPGGMGTKAFWELLCAGRTATRPITFFDPSEFRSRIAGECDFDPLAEGLSAREARRLDRAGQLALVAMREAVADSGVVVTDPERVGISLGTAVGATTTLDIEYRVASDDGRRWEIDHSLASPTLYDAMVPSALAAELAWEIGAEGPVSLVSDGCTSGIDAVGWGAEIIAEGEADIVVAGGTDAPISPITLACFDAIKATTNRNEEAATASRPFDATRNGFVLAEGSAILILEEAEVARRRGATIYGAVSGYASHCNAYSMTGLRKDGAEMAAAATEALTKAQLPPDAVDYVNAHGSGTKHNDRHETNAVKTSLGDHARHVPMSSIKSMVGHSLGAIGSIELAACALAITHNVVPPTANLHNPDRDCDLDYVPLTAREHRVDTVLSVGSGFGGFQSAIVVDRYPRRSA